MGVCVRHFLREEENGNPIGLKELTSEKSQCAYCLTEEASG